MEQGGSREALNQLELFGAVLLSGLSTLQHDNKTKIGFTTGISS